MTPSARSAGVEELLHLRWTPITKFSPLRPHFETAHFAGGRMAEVLVVGAGPVGLMMAAELARHGIRCRIIDRLAEPSPYCRAIGVTPRTLEIWDDIGIA